ncbi:MAG: hypothetical protein KBB11_00080 [Bacteroidales bacterium]|nr:hypothetical protein [Bacteroidales bacterium]HOY39730.1 hypothetical protein [Bacteroidales bacterium]HQP03912.1 hypothetical protein [Bacteroidales bacterium]
MKHFALFFLLLLSFAAYSQSDDEVIPDSRLYVRFSADYINVMLQSDPKSVEYLNFELDFGYKIMDAGLEKCEGLPYLHYFNSTDKTVEGIVEDINESSINIMEYHYDRNYDKPNIYRIGNTGQVIIFYSLKDLNRKFNQN